MRVRFLFALCLPLWGCSDGSNSLPPGSPPPSESPTPSVPVPAPAGTPNVADPTEPPQPILILKKGTLDWPFMTSVDGANAGAVFSPTAGEDGDVRFTFGADGKHATILTHAHYDLTEGHQSILVRARASEPRSILVTIARLDHTTDYWSELDAGHPWRVADVALETTWTDFDIPIATMQARGPGEPQPFSPVGAQGIVLFGFLLPNPAAIDVWFEHIEIK